MVFHTGVAARLKFSEFESPVWMIVSMLGII